MNVTSFTLLDALAELADAAALAALLLAAVLDAVDAALVEALAELADELAAELEACWPQPASAIAIASANAIASTEKSFEFRFIVSPLWSSVFCRMPSCDASIIMRVLIVKMIAAHSNCL